MNEHDDLGPGRDVLKQTISALVGGATPSGVPSAPEQNLGLLRRKVRRWRIAKAGVVGLSTAVVISALAFGTTQATAWNWSEPLPGRPTVQATETGPVPSELPTSRPSQSSTVSASPSPSLSPSSVPVEPTSALELIEDGFRPSGWGVSEITCGMSADELSSTEQGFRLAVAGEVTDDGEDTSIPFRLTPTSGDPITEWYSPTLMWIHDGTVVGVPSDYREGAAEPSVQGGGGPVEFPLIVLHPYSLCAPEPTPDDFDPNGPIPRGDGYVFPHELPPGDYEVVALIQEFKGGENDPYVLSDPVPVTITEDQQVVRRPAGGGTGD
jgi:hypothetical protein